MSDWLQYVAADFSDLPNVGEAIRMTVRLLLAAMLGALLGYDRERVGKAAGLRTHMLVALGTALFVIIPQQAGLSDADISRVIQGLATGIGFLGAGAIVKGRQESEIQGLTTAAGIWVTAAIGIAAGLGREASAILGAILAFIILSGLGRVSKLIDRQMPTQSRTIAQTNAASQVTANR
jgi:putative Mg2+ transporter-C (MgtC) family protein